MSNSRALLIACLAVSLVACGGGGSGGHRNKPPVARLSVSPTTGAAPLAAEAAYEAFVQKGNDGFWKFHGKLFEKQPDIKRPTLEAIAQ